MSKKELIQIRVSEDEKLKIKTIARKKGMTVSEFILYSLMRTISEYEIYELIKKWKFISNFLCSNLRGFVAFLWRKLGVLGIVLSPRKH